MHLTISPKLLKWGFYFNKKTDPNPPAGGQNRFFKKDRLQLVSNFVYDSCKSLWITNGKVC